ncbi:hypothetical protein OH459_27430 [Vibrio sp. MM46]|uniref:hypothetical protein n=1 Tax=Vibrio sp. MM46 TaxID=2998835 RepID=UPI0022CDABE0|nr:hypothetical protein [Vibrio sp. MM46]MDA0126312.1 hypothetical protein [Vibrio sp. MM46]
MVLDNSKAVLSRYPILTEMKGDLENLDEIGMNLLKKFVVGKKSNKLFYTSGCFVTYRERNYSLSSGYVGGEGSKINIWKRIKNEFYLLFCTEEKKYEAARKRIERMNGACFGAVLTTVCAAIAKALGMVFGAIAGSVVALLWALFSVGKNAYCGIYEQPT